MEWLLYWHWFTLALLLVIAETLGAAGFLLGLGMAAATMGVLTWMFFISWQWQLTGFSILCLVFAVAWWRSFKEHAAASPTLINRPMEAMVGRTTNLIEAIENGRGKIQINGTHWFVTGPDCPSGTRVRIVAIQEDSLIVVEPAPPNHQNQVLG